jgi:hypothetical protein
MAYLEEIEAFVSRSMGAQASVKLVGSAVDVSVDCAPCSVRVPVIRHGMRIPSNQIALDAAAELRDAMQNTK